MEETSNSIMIVDKESIILENPQTIRSLPYSLFKRYLVCDPFRDHQRDRYCGNDFTDWSKY